MSFIRGDHIASGQRTTSLMSWLSGSQWRFCVRVTASAVLAFGLAQLFSIPLHGLWAVLTAVMVTQINVGGSAKATADYAIGTLCGVVYAGAVADLVPHTTALATAGVLALAIAPLAYAATLSPSFRVAPFTAVLVLLISVEIHQTPIASASYRLLEVAIGGAVAMAVSVLIFPARAYLMRLHAAAQVLERLARALPVMLQGFQIKSIRCRTSVFRMISAKPSTIL